MKKLLIFLLLIYTGAIMAQVPYKQKVEFKNNVTFDVSPIAPYATSSYGLIPLQQYQDSIQLISDRIDNISVTGGVAQVNSDWNSITGVSEIYNKPETESIETESIETESIETVSIDDIVLTKLKVQAKTYDYVLTLADVGTTITMNSTAAQNIYIPTNVNEAFPINSYIDIIRLGTGDVTINYYTGVTIYSESSFRKIIAQYASVRLLKLDTDTWIIIGRVKS